MTDKTEQEIRDGLEAGQILESPVFKSALDEMEEELLTAWKRTNARDRDERERLWTMLQLLEMLKTNLSNKMISGQIAHKKLMDERKSRGMSLYG